MGRIHVIVPMFVGVQFPWVHDISKAGPELRQSPLGTVRPTPYGNLVASPWKVQYPSTTVSQIAEAFSPSTTVTLDNETLRFAFSYLSADEQPFVSKAWNGPAQRGRQTVVVDLPASQGGSSRVSPIKGRLLAGSRCMPSDASAEQGRTGWWWRRSLRGRDGRQNAVTRTSPKSARHASRIDTRRSRQAPELCNTSHRVVQQLPSSFSKPRLGSVRSADRPEPPHLLSIHSADPTTPDQKPRVSAFFPRCHARRRQRRSQPLPVRC